MKKLKELLMESYAWEKKPGKPLPTLSEVQAEYERKMAEQYDYGNRKPKFGKGSMYNDEPDFDKGAVGGTRNNIVNTKWDAIVDEYNSKSGYKIETNTNPRVYLAKITNTQTGDWWEAKFKNVVWTYTCEIGGKWSYLKSIDELIKKFNEVNTI